MHAILVCMHALCMPYVVITSGRDTGLNTIGLPSIKLIGQVCYVTIVSLYVVWVSIQYDHMQLKLPCYTAESFGSVKAPRQKQGYRNIYEL